jgi:hypothetical protein
MSAWKIASLFVTGVTGYCRVMTGTCRGFDYHDDDVRSNAQAPSAFAIYRYLLRQMGAEQQLPICGEIIRRDERSGLYGQILTGHGATPFH